MKASESQRLQHLCDVIRQHAQEGEYCQAPSPRLVQECQRQLGTELPESFLGFLQQFGGTYWPREVYGVSEYPELDLLSMTTTEREEAEPSLPRHLVPFGPDGWGNHFCLDTARLVDGECPVVFWNHELAADQVPELTHPTFLDWLEQQVAQRLEEDRAGNA
jgi:hypothetical protein